MTTGFSQTKILTAAAFLVMVALLAFSLVDSNSDADVTATPATTVNIYSYRQPFLIEPLFAEFTAETGIQVKTVFASKGLIERVALEGKRSPVDVVLTKNFHHLQRAGETVARPVESEILSAHIPPALRDPENRWFALTQRARVLFVSKERVSETSISYESLADPKWRGRLCMRSGQHPYNLSLFAGLLTHYGEDWTQTWLEGVKANLTGKPAGNDRAQVKQVFSGACDVALSNTYYMGAMLDNEKNPEQKDWASSVRMVFPTGQDFGTHVNVSGMIMAKYAPNPEAAQKFMEFMVSEKAQKVYAQTNYEYPARQSVPASNLVASWGALHADTTPLSKIADHYEKTSLLVDKVGFND